MKKTKEFVLCPRESKKQEKRKVSLSNIHLIADFWNGEVIEEEKKIKKILIEAAKKAKNTPLKIAFHKFHPYGFTGIILLAESHIALHFWPEFNYLAVDIYTCGRRSKPYQALKYLEKVFKPKKVKIREIKRGKR